MMEKQIKPSAEKIKMPEETRRRILEKCAEIEKAEHNGTSDYTDHVFEVERVGTHRIRRIISGIAACAVIAGGIGVTGALLHRNGSINSASEITEEVSNRISPFGDFNNFEYYLMADDGLYGQYSPNTYKEIANYLNNFDWGEETEGSFFEEELKAYLFSWQTDDGIYNLGIREDDLAIYFKIPKNNTSDEVTYEFIKYYRVDFKKFEEGLKKIIEPACDDSLTKAREELKTIIRLPLENDDFTAKLVYDTADKDMRPDELQDTTIVLSDELIEKFEKWIYANSYELSKDHSLSHMSGRLSPEFGKVYFDVNIYNDNNLTYQFSFLEDGYFVYTQYELIEIADVPVPSECKRLCFKGNGMDTLKALVAEEPTGFVNVDNDEWVLESVREEIQDIITKPVNNDNMKAELFIHPEDIPDIAIPESLQKDNIEMSDAMIYGMASWLDENADSIIIPKNQMSIVFFSIKITENNKTVATLDFSKFNDERILTYTNTSDSITYTFNADGFDALNVIFDAADTEIKHTEDNAAYYLPGFNFEKHNFTGNVENNKKLQDIFYGFNWAEHEVTDVNQKSLHMVYRFCVGIGENTKRVLDICENGYIHLYDADSDNNLINPENEKIYKFSDDSILYAVREIHNETVPDVPGATKADYTPLNGRDDYYNFFKESTIQYYNGNKELWVLSEKKTEEVWKILDKIDWDNELPDKFPDYDKLGTIKISFSDTYINDFGGTSIHVTENGYIVVSAPDGNHVFKPREDGSHIVEDLNKILG